MYSRFFGNIHQLKKHLNKGGLVAYPTESCYGLGCLPKHHTALRRLIRLKKRPADKGFITIAAHFHQLHYLVDRLPEKDKKQLNAQWPSTQTYLLPAKKQVPALLRGRGRHKMGVRIPDHSLARALCHRLQTALVSSSANRHNGKTCRDERSTRRLFGKQVWVIGGQIGKYKKPSSIIDFETKKVFR